MSNKAEVVTSMDRQRREGGRGEGEEGEGRLSLGEERDKTCRWL